LKFKLFGRLRDDDEDSNQNTSPGLGDQAMDGGKQLSGGSLERTVENMFDQGYSEEEIQQELQGQYDEQEITRAVNNTVKDNATTSNEGPEPMTPYQSDEEAVSPMDEGYDSNQEQNPEELQQQSMDQNQQMPPQNNQQPVQQPQEPIPQQDGQQGRQTVDPATEELIETIVAENFQRVKSEFQNMYQELDTIEEAVEDLENRVHDLEVRDDEDQEQFVQKVDEMEEHIDNYQSRIGGLEKAFQQVLPSLVDNVRDLTSLVQEMKQEKGIETETNVDTEKVEDMNQELEDW